MKPIHKPNTRSNLLFAITLCISSAHGLCAVVSQNQALNFGSIVPRMGNCEMDPTNGNIIIGNDICLASSNRGHYQLVDAANVRFRIRLNSAVDDNYAINFEQKFMLQNNYGTQISGIAGVAEELITGSDGIIDIYVGGLLNINQTLPNNTNINVSFNIEYEER
ncbi:DUF4402 domain-containing protein [Algibacillus agarilyticus]|uniref:DUF4402 domain-containing protein n=1 Tax=Algibacillus agarilyticus TaxID=2234133 RepID=UPI000DCFD315|nr:DUF4402 domain-containing protein [Algibacillus agarilyticus]